MPHTEFRIDGKPMDEHRDNPAPEPARNDADGRPEDAPDERPLEEKVVDALKEVYDPEIPVNIYELGLIYGVDIDESSHVKVTMTLTSPACPVAGELPGEVRASVERVPEVEGCEVELTFDPPWSMDKMSEEARLMLGFM